MDRDPDISERPSPPTLRDPTPLAAPPVVDVRRRRQALLAVVLFMLTFISAVLSQVPPRANEGLREWLIGALSTPARLHQGFLFAVTLMVILLAHEMGHYLTARRYGVDQSPPFFIPAPTIFGTFGAVILMRSQPPNRRVLLNVAVMGPYAGLLLAIPAAAWGLAHSTPFDAANAEPGSVWFGSSLLFRFLENTFSPNGADVLLHPVALAGWVGMFVTSLNLIPAAQLDGGHVAYALLGRHQVNVSLGVVVLLLGTGTFISCLGEQPEGGFNTDGLMWIIWAVLLFVIGLRHPPVRDESVPLSKFQKANAVVALGVFALTFIPIPAKIIGEPTRPADSLPPSFQPLPLGPSDGAPAAPAEEFRL